MDASTGVSLQQRAEQILQLLDAMDVEGLSAMLTDDVQSVDELTRGWTRGRAAVEAYLSELKDTISDARSRVTDAREAVWGDAGLITFVLEQTYTMDGGQHSISAPTSFLFRREDGDWKIALIHTVPLPEPA